MILHIINRKITDRIARLIVDFTSISKRIFTYSDILFAQDDSQLLVSTP